MPILRAEMTASLGMSEPGAGSDLASLRTRAVLETDGDGDHFVVNGQKVWTSGAHDADVLLAFVRTDPNAPKHKGISALMIPTDLPGVVRRPVRVGVRSGTTSTSTRSSSTMRGCPPRISSARSTRAGGSPTDLSATNGTCCGSAMPTACRNSSRTTRARRALDRDRYATLVMDNQALRLLGSIALARAARGDEDAGALSVLKLFGSEASQIATEHALAAAGPDGAGASGRLRPVLAVPPRPLPVRLVRALYPVFRRHHRRRYLRNPTQHHRPATARAAPQLSDKD